MAVSPATPIISKAARDLRQQRQSDQPGIPLRDRHLGGPVTAAFPPGRRVSGRGPGGRLVRPNVHPLGPKASTCQKATYCFSWLLAPCSRRPHGAKPWQPAMPPTRPCGLGERSGARVSAQPRSQQANCWLRFAKLVNRCFRCPLSLSTAMPVISRRRASARLFACATAIPTQLD